MDYPRRVGNHANTAVICSDSDGLGFLIHTAYQRFYEVIIPDHLSDLRYLFLCCLQIVT